MLKDVNIFKAGLQTAESGMSREFTVGELDEIVKSYDPLTHEAPIRIGHEDNDKVPAWGWVKSLIRKGEDLYAKVDFSPLAQDFIKDGLYKKVSASFYSPASKINPHPGKWSLRHVALLGAQPPAVKGLKGFAYEEFPMDCWSFSSELKPEEIYDPELGPTIKENMSPLKMLKDRLDKAREESKMESGGEADMVEVEVNMKEKEVEVEEVSTNDEEIKDKTEPETASEKVEETVKEKAKAKPKTKAKAKKDPEPEMEKDSEDVEMKETAEVKKDSEGEEDLAKVIEEEVSGLLKELNVEVEVEDMQEQLVEEVEVKEFKKEKEKKVSYSEVENPDMDKIISRIKELEEANSKLKADVEFAERKAFRTSLKSFTDTLYDSGKLTESVIKQSDLVDYMEGLEYGTYQFSEGESIITPLVNLLNRLPQIISYGEVAPETEKVYSEPQDPHEKALQLARESGISYSEALKKALFG